MEKGSANTAESLKPIYKEVAGKEKFPKIKNMFTRKGKVKKSC